MTFRTPTKNSSTMVKRQPHPIWTLRHDPQAWMDGKVAKLRPCDTHCHQSLPHFAPLFPKLTCVCESKKQHNTTMAEKDDGLALGLSLRLGCGENHDNHPHPFNMHKPPQSLPNQRASSFNNLFHFHDV
ncbi:hypothetical protein CR513_27104, partial [Mucuna pruriens]